MTFPSVAGAGGSFVVPKNNAPAGTKLTLTTAVGQLQGAPGGPSGPPCITYAMQPSATFRLQGTPAFTTVSDVHTCPGYVLYVYLGGMHMLWPQSVNGDTETFAAGGSPVKIIKGTNYYFELGITTLPTPTPSPR